MDAIRHYTLDDDGNPVPCSFDDWIAWLQHNDYPHTVAFDQITAVVHVSTVFLGIDHRFTDAGPPLIFETMVFRDDQGEDQWRWSTRNQALEYAQSGAGRPCVHRRRVARCACAAAVELRNADERSPVGRNTMGCPEPR